MTAQWAFVSSKGPDGRNERITVYVVDEHGCQLNTEPICSVVADYHSWFVPWLKQQPCPYPNAELLWHPALGETIESYLAGRK